MEEAVEDHHLVQALQELPQQPKHPLEVPQPMLLLSQLEEFLVALVV